MQLEAQNPIADHAVSSTQNNALQNCDDINKVYGLNAEAITELIVKNTEYYHDHLYFWDGMGVEPGNNLVQLALADITGDGLPEVFIGGRNGLEDTKYTAYTNDLTLLPIGEETNEVLDGIAFSCVSTWGGRRQMNETPNMRSSTFLFSKKFIDMQSECPYYYVRGGNGRFGASSEAYWFTRFWEQGEHWNTEVEHGEQDCTDQEIFDPYYRIAVAEKTVFGGASAIGHESDVLESVNACIVQYDKRMKELLDHPDSSKLHMPINVPDTFSMSVLDTLLLDTEVLNHLNDKTVLDVRCAISFDEVQMNWGEPVNKGVYSLYQEELAWQKNTLVYWCFERNGIYFVFMGGNQSGISDEKLIANNIYILSKD